MHVRKARFNFQRQKGVLFRCHYGTKSAPHHTGQKSTVFSLDMLLRTLSRGQAYDVLSSQAGIAGYRAVVEAANAMQRPFAGQMTAAGKLPPTKVLVVGAGVAGLAAIQV